MRSLSLAALLVLLTLPVNAGDAGPGRYHVTRSSAGSNRIDIVAERASLAAVVNALQLHLQVAVILDLETDRIVDFKARGLSPEAMLKKIARLEQLSVERVENGYLLRDANEPRVTLDVKEVDVREIFKLIKPQCGIRNLMIDPEVQAKGTFLFHDVPCNVAIRTILQSLGLGGEIHPNSIVRVSRSR